MMRSTCSDIPRTTIVWYTFYSLNAEVVLNIVDLFEVGIVSVIAHFKWIRKDPSPFIKKMTTYGFVLYFHVKFDQF